MSQKMLQKDLLEKWAGELDATSDSTPAIASYDKRVVTAQLLENTEVAIASGQFAQEPHALMEDSPSMNTTSGVKNFDPVLISLIRRAAPKLIAHELLGVQPMTGPTGQIFALRSRYDTQTGAEAFYGEANTGHSSVRGGDNTIVGDATMNVGKTPSGNAELYNYAAGMSLEQAEMLGVAGNTAWRQMAISIEQVQVKADSRKLKATFTHEFAQDLKAIHGLDAVRELSNVLATELTAELNREIIRSIYLTAVQGAPASRVTTAGTIDLDTDTNGRWLAERFVGLNFQLQLEANDIAKRTRRGKGNIMICSSTVAAALEVAKIIDTREAYKLQVNDAGNTYAGNIGAIRVYIDPYAEDDFAVLGYKGNHSWDAGMYYCPYTPLQLVRAVDTETFNPAMGFQTRAGFIANPFSGGATPSDGKLRANSNVYFSRVAIRNIM